MTSADQERTSTFVLVHGAWHGGWCWRRVVPLLRRAGHEVFTPSLTGLGDRAHLSLPEINLDTHIQDILMLIIKDWPAIQTLGIVFFPPAPP